MTQLLMNQYLMHSYREASRPEESLIALGTAIPSLLVSKARPPPALVAWMIRPAVANRHASRIEFCSEFS